MGQQITYEIAKLNPGRRVKVWSNGRGLASKQHGMGAKIVGMTDKYAEVRIDNHPTVEKVEWSGVRDWTMQNADPLVLPPAAPKLEPVKIAPPAAAPAPARSPEPMPSANGDPFAVFGALSQVLPEIMSAIAAAEDEIDAATEMLQQARAKHGEHVQRLADVRKQVAAASAMIDNHLTGTNAAPIPARA